MGNESRAESGLLLAVYVDEFEVSPGAVALRSEVSSFQTMMEFVDSWGEGDAQS